MVLRHRLKPLLIGIGAGAVPCLAGLAFFANAVFSFDPQAPAAGDAVVVLTGGELRVREGLRLFAGGAGRRLLISGVHPATSRDDLRRLSGVAPMLFECCVDIDHVARDTAGNAAETRAWIEPWGFRRLVVVTSNYHMPRSLMVLARALPGVELVPHVVVSRTYQPREWWRHPGAVKRVFIEYLKFLPAATRLVVSQTIGLGRKPPLSLPPGVEVSITAPRPAGF